MRSLQRVQLWIRQLAMFQPTRSTIAVIGTTGVGKSQLGIELSKALHGEVINADSMQVREYTNVYPTETWQIITSGFSTFKVYKGLDIITNKVTESERENVPHHLMDFLEPEEEYLVTQFVKDASDKASKI
jgi:tRNA dimethylallyltransferase